MKRLLFALGCLLMFTSMYGQYNPGLHTVTSKPLAINAGGPTDARSFFYDASLFKYRPYQSTAEVLAYLNLAKYRVGYFPVYINVGGTLSAGVFTGGTIHEYIFKDGTADGNLVEKPTGSGAAADSAVMQSKYATDTAKANIRNSGYLTSSTGDARYPQLSGSYVNPSWLTSIPWTKVTSAPAFITGNQTITVTGDASGSGTTGISLTLPTVNSTPAASPGFYKIASNGKGLTTQLTPVTSTDISTLLGGTPAVLNGNGAQVLKADGTYLTIDDANSTSVPTRDSLTKYPGGRGSAYVYADSPYNGHYLLKTVTWADNGTTILTPLSNSSKRWIFQPDLNSGGSASSSGGAGIIQASNGSGGLQTAGSMLYVSSGFDSLFLQSGTPKDFIIKSSRNAATVARVTRIFGVDNVGSSFGGPILMVGGKGANGNGGATSIIGGRTYNVVSQRNGDATVQGGQNDSTNSTAGNALVQGGDNTAGTNKAGMATVKGGQNTVATADGGDVLISGGNAGTGKGGDVSLYGGVNSAGSYQTVNIFMDTLQSRNPTTGVVKWWIDSTGNMKNGAWATGLTKYLSVDASGNVIPTTVSGGSTTFPGTANQIISSDGASGAQASTVTADASGNLVAPTALSTSGTPAFASFYASQSGVSTSTATAFNFYGSLTTAFRRSFRSNQSFTLGASNNYVATIFGGETQAKATSGTADLWATVGIKPQLASNPTAGEVFRRGAGLAVIGRPSAIDLKQPDSTTYAVIVDSGGLKYDFIAPMDSLVTSNTITLSDVRSLWINKAASNATWTLPRLTSNKNLLFELVNATGNTITVNTASGSSVINPKATGGNVNSLTIAAWGSIRIREESDGSEWLVLSYSN